MRDTVPAVCGLARTIRLRPAAYRLVASCYHEPAPAAKRMFGAVRADAGRRFAPVARAGRGTGAPLAEDARP